MIVVAFKCVWFVFCVRRVDGGVFIRDRVVNAE